MEIRIHNTSKIVDINGVPARVWEGITDKGVPIHCFITRIGVATKEDQEDFEKDLQQMAPPSVYVPAIPLRLLI